MAVCLNLTERRNAMNSIPYPFQVQDHTVSLNAKTIEPFEGLSVQWQAQVHSEVRRARSAHCLIMASQLVRILLRIRFSRSANSRAQPRLRSQNDSHPYCTGWQQERHQTQLCPKSPTILNSIVEVHHTWTELTSLTRIQDAVPRRAACRRLQGNCTMAHANCEQVR